MTGPGRLPLTYDECRARFRHAADLADLAGLSMQAEPITARGPYGQELTVDIVVGGADPVAARRALLVLSGVHGVEGFVGSALQCDLLARTDVGGLPADVSVVLVHAVNPWGMAHSRRQNESNVDLNRNWARDRREPQHNDAYDEIHALACPDSAGPPSVEQLLADAAEVVAARGAEWLREAITRGQYRHPDGLHFGGDRLEESTAVLERAVIQRLHGADEVLIVDLHTGEGPYGELVTLSDRPEGSAQDVLLRSLFDTVRATAPSADGGPSQVKAGPVARGIADDLAGADCTVATIEVGTAGDLEQLAATYREQWVHRRGDLADPDHRAIRWAYRCCFTPDDPDWERAALESGRRHLDAAMGWLVDRP